jgi:hypothetical protein
MKSLDAQLRRYRAAALIRAASGDGPADSNNARKRSIRQRAQTVHEMRSIAKDICRRGPEEQKVFAGLLSEREPLHARRWAAFHILELCSLSAEVEAHAVSVIESVSLPRSADWVGDQVWLRRWRASRGSRAEIVAELCRIPADFRLGKWSMVDLLRSTGRQSWQNLTAAEVSECFHKEPELVDVWFGYSHDERVWLLTEISPKLFELRQFPSGDPLWFTDRVAAIAEFAVRVIRSIGEHTD